MINKKSNVKLSDKSDLRLLAKSIVFSTLALIGFGTIVLFAFTELNWSLLVMLYSLLVYLGYIEFF